MGTLPVHRAQLRRGRREMFAEMLLVLFESGLLETISKAAGECVCVCVQGRLCCFLQSKGFFVGVPVAVASLAPA